MTCNSTHNQSRKRSVAKDLGIKFCISQCWPPWKPWAWCITHVHITYPGRMWGLWSLSGSCAWSVFISCPEIPDPSILISLVVLNMGKINPYKLQHPVWAAIYSKFEDPQSCLLISAESPFKFWKIQQSSTLYLLLILSRLFTIVANCSYQLQLMSVPVEMGVMLVKMKSNFQSII